MSLLDLNLMSETTFFLALFIAYFLQTMEAFPLEKGLQMNYFTPLYMTSEHLKTELKGSFIYLKSNFTEQPKNNLDFYRYVAESYNMSKGTYIEVGTGDFQSLSVSYNLEQEQEWYGITIDCDLKVKDFVEAKRTAIFSNTCVGTLKYSHDCLFGHKQGYKSRLVGPEDSNEFDKITVTNCYPLYSYMLALNRSDFDLLILDVGGAEMAILKTIPFDKVRIGGIIVTCSKDSEIQDFDEYLQSLKYTKLKSEGNANFYKQM